MRRALLGSVSVLIVAGATSACRVKPARPGDRSLNGEKNLTNSVWMFGFDKFAARQLADRARGNGLIAVKLIDSENGEAQLQVINGCAVAGRYQYRSMSTVDDRIVIKSADELKAKLPFSYGTFEGELSQKSELHIEYRTPGDYVAPDGPYQLTGNCAEATHVVTYLTIGAFKTSSASSNNTSAGGGAFGMGASGGSSSSNEQSTAGGNFNSCKMDYNIFGSVAPLDCSMPLKLTLAPIRAPEAAPPPPAAGGAVAVNASVATTNTCNDQGVMANQAAGFMFDGSVFVIERPQIAKMNAAAKVNFSCLPNIDPGESLALDGVIAFLKKRPGVRAHVSVYCSVLVPGLDPAAADQHKAAVQGKFAAAGVGGQVSFDSCLGMAPFMIGDGVRVELTGGCTDLAAPPPTKCKGAGG